MYFGHDVRSSPDVKFPNTSIGTAGRTPGPAGSPDFSAGMFLRGFIKIVSLSQRKYEIVLHETLHRTCKEVTRVYTFAVARTVDSLRSFKACLKSL
jgi:hypothetical protein